MHNITNNTNLLIGSSPWDIELVLRRMLANPEGYDVVDKEEWKFPAIGDRIKIISWDEQVDVKECLRVGLFKALIIKDIFPVLVGIGNDKYAWCYTVAVEDTYLTFLQFNYKIEL